MSHDGRPIAVTRPQRRAVLAYLLLHATRGVRINALIEAMWAGAEPATARTQIHAAVSGLRRGLRESGTGDLIESTPSGYLLRVAEDDLDLTAFTGRVHRAEQAEAGGRPEAAVALLREAMGLWRGQALADILAPFADAARTHLDEQRVAALEQLAELELSLGRGVDLVPDLLLFSETHPTRERLVALLMLALYRDGRQVDALDLYARTKTLLAAEQGVDPGPRLTERYLAILRAEPALDAPAAAPPVRPAVERPSREPETVPAELPRGVPDFTGRLEHLRALDLLAAQDNQPAAVVAALSGSGGVGKTALAVHWGHRASARFPDGQLFVDLHGHSPSRPLRPVDALARFLRGLGVPQERIPAEAEEASAQFRSLVAGRRVLVLLDNASDAEQVRPLLPATPGSMALVTSRERLIGLTALDGARQVGLDVLDPADAVRLLGGIVGPHRVEAEPEAARDIAELCACLPLALRVFGATIASEPELSLADQRDRLRESDRMALLRIDGDERSGVRASFELSYAVLKPESRRLFRLLGVCPGHDVGVEAAAALADLDATKVRRLLDVLVAARLVDRHPGDRFTSHDLLREYAAELAGEEESPESRGQALARLSDWYLRRCAEAADQLYPNTLRLPAPPARGVVAAFVDAAAARRWLDTELPGMVAVIGHAARHGPGELAWRLADVLHGYFRIRPGTVEWARTVELGMAAATEAGDAAASAAMRLSAGALRVRLDRESDARAQFEQAAVDARRAGWGAAEVAAMLSLGQSYSGAGDLRTAAGYYQRAATLNETVGWSQGAGFILNSLGVIYRDLGDLDRALSCCLDVLRVFRELGRGRQLGVSLANLGMVRHQLGALDLAMADFAAAEAAFDRSGDRLRGAWLLPHVALAELDLGRREQARDRARRGLDLAREIEEPGFESLALHALGSVCLRADRPEEAAGHFGGALDLATRVGFLVARMDAMLGLAAADAARGEEAAALDGLRRLLAMTAESGHLLHEGQARTILAGIHLREDRERAAEEAERALRIHRGTGHRLGAARTLVILGHASAAEPQRAAEAWREARDLFAAAGSPEADDVARLLTVPTNRTERNR
ncbi:tetratricopeptide repeat protein [Solihabitans fulvus]|uniref:Tetratricopeptide repeat protein n=1 Tax=Solihabitans fulvus TaxID=1892852 RepID=A0A5B2XJQ1_9PSEU|nr:BTAD domain-containing putative transcriptional regulator [Solihabitans fulvus]KAA2263384.1 tetratricopeptide repeat protein [Solihabitans fulvus]